MTGFFPTDFCFEVIDSSSTGIKQPEASGAASLDKATWYDRQGNKYNAKPTVPGLDIVNGKKIISKSFRSAEYHHNMISHFVRDRHPFQSS